jgi:hypothetical protein
MADGFKNLEVESEGRGKRRRVAKHSVQRLLDALDTYLEKFTALSQKAA